MTNKQHENAALVGQLIEAITEKLAANRGVLAKSLHYGRLTWRVSKNGEKIEIYLEPKL